MIPWPMSGGAPAVAPGAITVNGALAGGLIIPWISTARDRRFDGSTSGDVNDSATRTAQTCFMRGLKERIEIQTNSPHTWRWRRICFTMKSTDLVELNDGTAFNLWLLTSGGYVRALPNLNVPGNTNSLEQRDKLVEMIFKGKFNTDWLNGYTAKLDTNRITPLYDKVVTLRSGNDRGSAWMFNRWHAMNKNLIYEDDEDGGAEDTNVLSIDGKAGMGDYYVVDLIEAAEGAGESDQLAFKPHATLYWHEK